MDEFISMPAITVICYLVAELYKAITPESCKKNIPVICGAAGAAMGIACYIFVPGCINAENVIVAAATGAVSGWAATGANQIIKQRKH